MVEETLREVLGLLKEINSNPKEICAECYWKGLVLKVKLSAQMPDVKCKYSGKTVMVGKWKAEEERQKDEMIEWHH